MKKDTQQQKEIEELAQDLADTYNMLNRPVFFPGERNPKIFDRGDDLKDASDFIAYAEWLYKCERWRKTKENEK